jgi:hypothetical protein
MAKKKTRERYRVSAEDFVKVHNECNTAAEVSERLGMPRNIVHARRAVYKKKGINLKDLDRSPRANTLDVEKLNNDTPVESTENVSVAEPTVETPVETASV